MKLCLTLQMKKIVLLWKKQAFFPFLLYSFNLWPLFLQGQNYQLTQTLRFRNFGPSDGLSFQQIETLCQDHYGLIWVAAGSVLYKYNGAGFVPYQYEEDNPNSIQMGAILCIFEDSRDRLWIGTTIGLCRYDREQDCLRRV